MDKKEKELFKSLCSFKSKSFNEELIDAATPEVLGHLFFNRMPAVAYGTLKKHGLLGRVNREFCNSLKGAYIQNCEKNKSYFECVEYLRDLLFKFKGSYAMLKGAYLCKLYPDGYRTSNDIDLLVQANDVSEIGEILIQGDFKQGNVRCGKFEPATRKDIIESKMTRGETVPYVKEINLPGMQFLEVDINFSLDYKPGDADLLEEIMKNTAFEEIEGFRVRTLKNDDFFVHLCTHLYKEATTLPWVEMMRDMTLYKYCDIYLFLNDASTAYVDFVFERAKELNLEKICAFVVIQMSGLFTFENTYALTKAKEILKNDPDYIHTVYAPKDKKPYIYIDKDIESRFFSNNRKLLLKEKIQ